jgi:ribosomal protein L28
MGTLPELQRPMRQFIEPLFHRSHSATVNTLHIQPIDVHIPMRVSSLRQFTGRRWRPSLQKNRYYSDFKQYFIYGTTRALTSVYLFNPPPYGESPCE